MITKEEMLKGKRYEDLIVEQQTNFDKLYIIINKLRELYNKPMIITNCVRTMEEHIEIYRKKGITDKSKIPMKSKHLYAQAIDIADSNLELTNWLKNNPDIMQNLDIYCELNNSNWCHVQISPFGSYKPGNTRWFNP